MCVSLFVCACVYLIVFLATPRMCKLCIRHVSLCCAHVCQVIFDSIHVRFNHLCSFLAMRCVYKRVDELHKLIKLVAIATIYW